MAIKFPIPYTIEYPLQLPRTGAKLKEEIPELHDMHQQATFDFINEELTLIEELLNQRYGQHVELQHVDIEFGSDEGDGKTGLIPAIYWEHKECHFIIAKTHDGKYINQFFYGNEDQYGTGKEFYEDLNECIMTLLQVQADHELSRAGIIK